MRCAAALSTHPIPSHATGDVIADVLGLHESVPDLVLVVATASFGGAAEDILSTVQTLLHPRQLLFTASSGILAAGTEVSEGPALGVWVFWSEIDEDISVLDLENGIESLTYLEKRTLATAESVIVLADPALPNVTDTIEAVSTLRSTRAVTGGLLSGASGATVLRDSSGRSRRCVAVTFPSTSSHAKLVHGSVPLSRDLVATSVVGNMVCELDELPALEVVQQLLSTIEPEERSRTAKNLAIAFYAPETDDIVDVYKVLGADREHGALAVAGALPSGAMVSVHYQGSDDSQLGLVEAFDGTRAAGALLFSCSPLEPDDNHEGLTDLGHLSEALGTTAFAGIHVSSVIGPGSRGSGLSGAPLSAAIFGRPHY